MNGEQFQYSDGSNICVKDFSIQYFRFFISSNLIRYPIVKFLVIDTISNLDRYMSRQMNKKGATQTHMLPEFEVFLLKSTLHHPGSPVKQI